jgi:hypothetical protein
MGHTRPLPCPAATHQVLALWLHETCRVFEDRLTCPEDHAWFRAHQVSLLQQHFQLDYGQVVEAHDRLMFGNYLTPGVESKVGALVPQPRSLRPCARLARRAHAIILSMHGSCLPHRCTSKSRTCPASRS